MMQVPNMKFRVEFTLFYLKTTVLQYFDQKLTQMLRES